MINSIERLENHIDFISLKNEYLEVEVTNFGCTIVKVLVKDKNNQIQDVVLGYETITDYQNYDAYLGALVGRVANRIGGASFDLNGKTYSLAANNGPNCLHGGIKGFSYQIFDYEIKDNDEVVFHYLSPDGDENFPGNLDFYASYQLVKDKLVIHYWATSDQDTLINITNHSYFNLSGGPCNIDQHLLKVSASQIACVNNDGLTTGNIKDVTNTPFDFREEKYIGDQINQEDEQLKIAKGYDHPFIFDIKDNQVVLYCEDTGIELTVSTTLPQAQLYTANYLDGRIGKYGKPMNARDALCIETQNMPDSIHLEKEPTVILKKGERYDEMTSYQFRVR